MNGNKSKENKVEGIGAAIGQPKAEGGNHNEGQANGTTPNKKKSARQRQLLAKQRANAKEATATADNSGTRNEVPYGDKNTKDKTSNGNGVESGHTSPVPKKKNKQKKKNNKKATTTTSDTKPEQGDTTQNAHQNGGGSTPSKRNHRNNNGRAHGGSNNNHTAGASPYHKSRGKAIYEPFLPEEEALEHYASERLIRGTLRVVPGRQMTAVSFVTCDRGSLKRDVLVPTEVDRNRGMDGDTVYVQLYTLDDDKKDESKNDDNEEQDLDDTLRQLTISGEAKQDDGDDEEDEPSEEEEEEPRQSWREDDVQRRLWDPAHDMKKPAKLKRGMSKMDTTLEQHQQQGPQLTGKVVHIVSPAATKGRRRIVGRLLSTRDGFALGPTNKSLPLFYITAHEAEGIMSQERDYIKSENENENGNSGDPETKTDEGATEQTTNDINNATSTNSNKSSSISKQDVVAQNKLYQATYRHGSWKDNARMPACCDIKCLGDAFHPENETQALLVEFGVDHGEFEAEVLKDVEKAVKAGRHSNETKGKGAGNATMKVGLEGAVDLGWSPTPRDLQGRRDFRETRIFTIDPTTAKDLDDAVHIKQLPDGRVEIGVHIADVSHFIRAGSHVDLEAKRRATTVYLVDRTVPMLPRPLCEIACSLNENVDRLAFSCVWTMNMDGTLAKTKKGGKKSGGKPENEVWYGRSVIRSCARLDYNTAQNIIENKVKGEDPSEEVWPMARRPSGIHSMADVAKDVHLLHKVAKARRALRFESGALALHGVKLAFSFQDNDATTPNLCGAYPIKDSNRLIEEYMLMANFLVAQRLITHAGGRAVLRQHPAPLEDGLADVVLAASHFGYEIDPTSSQALQESLNKLERQCNDKLAIQCITQMMTTPMKPAEYIAAGEIEEEEWRHFALNIPYYTHFTSPIRRYADVIVHRLLQATLEGPEAVEDFPQPSSELHMIATHCNEKRMASKKAQERSDIVFLALFVKKEPIAKAMGIITSMGEKTFTVFVPSLGLSRIIFLDDHSPWFDWTVNKEARQICLEKKHTNDAEANAQQETSRNNGLLGPQLSDWPANKVSLTVFNKLYVSCICNPRPPIDIKFMIVSTFSV